MEKNLVETGIGTYVTDAMKIFGKDVNTKRQLPLIHDGLKPVYRRIIYETLVNSTGKMTKTASIAGRVIATTHMHGDQSVIPPISNLVRWGILDGQGNHGMKSLIGDDIDPAAARYTEACISQKYLNIFKDLMPYVPYVDAEMAGFIEPTYLPTPTPLCLTFSTLGIGIGVNTRIPAFTVKSMIDALLNDDPNLLEAPFGLTLVKEESELDSLWNVGIGRLTYSYKVYSGNSAAGHGVFIEGEAELFKPELSKLQAQRDLGRIFINDETDKTGTRIFIGRNYNVKAINYDQILELAKEAGTLKKTYRLTVSDGENVYLIPLKNWLKFTYDNYVELVKTYRLDKIEKYRFDYEVYDNLPKVVDLLYKNRDLTPTDISDQLKISLDIVTTILSKSINTLRNTDGGAKKLESIKEKIEYYTNLDPLTKVNELIDAF